MPLDQMTILSSSGLLLHEHNFQLSKGTLVRSPASRGAPRHLASGSNDNTTIIWDTDLGAQLLTLKGHTHSVRSIAWSQCNQLASASADPTVVVWNITTCEQVAQVTGHTDEVSSVAWGQGDQLASASEDQTAVVWNVASGEKL